MALSAVLAYTVLSPSSNGCSIQFTPIPRKRIRCYPLEACRGEGSRMKSAIATSLMIAIALPPIMRTASPERKLVYLNLVAVDGRGQSVTNLTSDEIIIEDAGKPQKIVLFTQREGQFAQPAQLPPDQYSNRDSAIAPHPTLILFDLLNERFATRGVAANEIVKSLQSSESSSDVYLYLLNVDGRVLSVRGMPEGGAAPPPGASAWTRDIKARLDAALLQALRVRPLEIDISVRTELTFRALDEVALELLRVPGRKEYRVDHRRSSVRAYAWAFRHWRFCGLHAADSPFQRRYGPRRRRDLSGTADHDRQSRRDGVRWRRDHGRPSPYDWKRRRTGKPGHIESVRRINWRPGQPGQGYRGRDQAGQERPESRV